MPHAKHKVVFIHTGYRERDEPTQRIRPRIRDHRPRKAGAIYMIAARGECRQPTDKDFEEIASCPVCYSTKNRKMVDGRKVS